MMLGDVERNFQAACQNLYGNTWESMQKVIEALLGYDIKLDF